MSSPSRKVQLGIVQRSEVMHLIITVAAVVVAARAQRSCSDYCKALQSGYSGDVWRSDCECTFGRQTNKQMTMEPPEKQPLRDVSAIYYEPSKEYPSISFGDDPFYIENPTFTKQKYESENHNYIQKLDVHKSNETKLTKKRSVKHKKSVEHIHKLDIEVDEMPLYLDIDIHKNLKNERFAGKENGEVDVLHLTEDDLIDCIDLHIVVYSRKADMENDLKDIWDEVKFEKYKRLSDSELIIEIKSKCHHPTKIVTESIEEIKKSRPKKSQIKSSTDIHPVILKTIKNNHHFKDKGKHNTTDVYMLTNPFVSTTESTLLENNSFEYGLKGTITKLFTEKTKADAENSSDIPQVADEFIYNKTNPLLENLFNTTDDDESNTVIYSTLAYTVPLEVNSNTEFPNVSNLSDVRFTESSFTVSSRDADVSQEKNTAHTNSRDNNHQSTTNNISGEELKENTEFPNVSNLSDVRFTESSFTVSSREADVSQEKNTAHTNSRDNNHQSTTNNISGEELKESSKTWYYFSSDNVVTTSMNTDMQSDNLVAELTYATPKITSGFATEKYISTHYSDSDLTKNNIGTTVNPNSSSGLNSNKENKSTETFPSIESGYDLSYEQTTENDMKSQYIEYGMKEIEMAAPIDSNLENLTESHETTSFISSLKVNDTKSKVEESFPKTESKNATESDLSYEETTQTHFSPPYADGDLISTNMDLTPAIYSIITNTAVSPVTVSLGHQVNRTGPLTKLPASTIINGELDAQNTVSTPNTVHQSSPPMLDNSELPEDMVSQYSNNIIKYSNMFVDKPNSTRYKDSIYETTTKYIKLYKDSTILGKKTYKDTNSLSTIALTSSRDLFETQTEQIQTIESLPPTFSFTRTNPPYITQSDVMAYMDGGRAAYSEQEIKIPKIITKEYFDDKVVSEVNGSEIIPNNDFKKLISSSELPDNETDFYEPTITTTEYATTVEIGSEFVPGASNLSKSSKDKITIFEGQNIVGKLYFLFDQVQVPARFVQNPNGEIKLGLDGVALCNKILQKQTHYSFIMTALCKCSESKNCTNDYLDDKL